MARQSVLHLVLKVHHVVTLAKCHFAIFSHKVCFLRAAKIAEFHPAVVTREVL